ncbi:unnamed protein product [Rotaria sordida]|uniref:Helitron helicase-like domain-containing protein n=1 Tax=Rotaria sordida TaxID=392033 RepID=A0A814S453_9BILA|nr:unnamed protein product [Rotaria sordida]
MDARAINNGAWSPNHFVPLLSPAIHYESDNSNQPTPIVVTPEKKTLKNNTVTQIRIPEFQSSLSRRLRTGDNIGIDSTQSTNPGTMQNSQNDLAEQHQSRLDKLKEQARISRMNETDEQRQNRLEKQKQRAQSSRTGEAEEHRQLRLEKQKTRNQSNQSNETAEQRQNRLEKKRERTRSNRTNETEEQRLIRLEQQRKRSQANKRKRKLEKRASDNSAIQQQDIDMQLNETEHHALRDGDKMDDLTRNENVVNKKKSSTSLPWPEPIAHKLKEACLQQFLRRMSMSALAETTCAVCNVRTPVQKTKKIPMSKIPHFHLLKVSDELKDVIISTQSSTSKNSNGDKIQVVEHAQIPSTLNSPSFYYENGIVLYTNGLSQQNKLNMCTLCQKCYEALSKEQIPKFSPANNMWLGDVPTELQGLTIPEEKLISLYRHNSCVIKLQSPFHSTTTAQAALKGNCITFLQNVPNIVSSLPLALDDLCDTLKVIFVGARPPERIHLKKILTVQSNSALNKLLHHIKTIGGRVMGSAYSRTALRTRIHALIYNQGLPSIFLTLNPADIHSPVALYFAGIKLDLDNIQMGQLMDTYKRAEIIASHPVATAKFFHLLISNILNTMISGGVLGPIKAYFGTVESQGRGSLHLHLLIWLDHDMKPADMKEKIQNADFREKLKAYLEDIIKEDLDEFKDKHVFENLHVTRTLNTPPRLSQDNIYAALRTMDLTGLGENINKSPVWSTPIKQQLSPSTPYAASLWNKSLHTPTHDRPTSVMNVLHNQSNINPACLPTPNPSSPNFAARFRADVVQLVETDNKHKHSDTCYKYSNPKQGDKKICRLRMPRKLVPVSTIDPDTGHISMRRSDAWINNFNEYLIAACRSNMDIKFIWSGSDAKALVYYITDYVTKMSLSFHDTFALVQKSITSFQNSLQQTSKESAIEKSRKLVLRCYNTLASQQELSGVQVASYLMNWDDHYTTHKFQGLFLIQTERFLQAQLNEICAKQKMELAAHDIIDDDVYDDDEAIDNENNDEEHFQIQLAENDKKYVLVNTRIDYQYRSDILNDMCLYDFVSALYKKKMNATDLKYLSKTTVPVEEDISGKGRPPNERFPFQKQHPQASTHLMIKYSEPHVPILYGPQIPRRDRDDTRERYSRALLTLFVPWRTVTDLCGANQTWEDALNSRQHLISVHSWKIIENIQLLHECKKDRDEHLLQVIAEAQVDNDAIDPGLLPANHDVHGVYDMDDSDDLLELLGNLDEYTTAAVNTTRKTTENKYIEETIEAVEKVGRFNHTNIHHQSSSDISIDRTNRQLIPFLCATPHLVQLNTKWQEQLKIEKERVRRSLITGNYDKDDDILDLFAARDAVVTVMNPNNYSTNNFENYGSILPVLKVINNFPTQTSIINEFTLNRE